MADNVAITPGTGATIAADDIGGVLHQRVNLSLGADGSAADAPGDGTNGLDVDVTRMVEPAMITGSGSLTALDQAVTLTLAGQAATTFQVTGTWVGTLTFEASNDNTNWTTIYSVKAGDNLIATTATSNDIYRCTTAGFGYVRLRCSAYTSGTIVVTANSSSKTSGVYLNFPLPAGTNIIGKVQPVNGFESTENIYVASVVASAAGASKNHLSVYNADAALKVDILQAYVTKETTAAVTGLTRGHRLFRFTTAHSAGSALTPLKLDTTMGALDADITARSGSTIGGAEAIPLGVVGVNEEETGAGGGRSILFDAKDYSRPITLNQNQGVVIQQDGTAGTGLVSAVIVFRVR